MRDTEAPKGTAQTVTAALLMLLAVSPQVRAESAATDFLAPAAVAGPAAATTAKVRPDDVGRGVPSAALAEGLGDYVEGAGSIAFFGSLLRAASLGDLLDLGGPYTLFVPVDSAFSGLSGQQLSDLIHDPRSLRALVAGHILPGRVLATDLEHGGSLVSISGQKIEATRGERPQVNGARLIKTPLAGPIVVHVIDGLLQRAEAGDA